MTFSASEAAFPRSFATLLDRRYDRPVFLQGLKRLIAAARERIYQEHCGGARGRNVVRHLTALVDDVVRTVFRYALACHPTDTSPCAVLALGGYGRGELNPFSDIDLMFLCHPQPPDRVIRETLYLLWDAGFTLGHSVRTRRDALRMAETDVTAQTAMLEARLVDGDESLFRWFQEEVGGRRFTRRRRRLFVRQKVTECRRRHAAFANTVNLMEPNVKESPGGLRDYHTALWLSMATYGTRSLAELVARGVLSSAEAEAVEAALDFLFTVRNGLHYHYGRKHDVLAVDVQEKLAAELRFAPSAEKRAVEQFLKTYYLHANVIYDFCLATLDAVTHVPRPRWWFRRPQAVGDGFVLLATGVCTTPTFPWPSTWRSSRFFCCRPLPRRSGTAPPWLQSCRVPSAPMRPSWLLKPCAARRRRGRCFGRFSPSRKPRPPCGPCTATAYWAHTFRSLRR
ncbi:MAG: hypothetical protein KatS3mg131_2886 [Candidatus Tectimicrobiota bacterium]|nr:MAG: hypothetical protein KatS3mg131_2886 [Candidatus Tectomicrobia bacterium]